MSDLGARFAAIFEGTSDAVGIGKAGLHVEVNQRHLRLFGYASRDEVIGRPVLDLIAPSERPAIAERARARAAGERVPDAYESLGLRKDGSEFDLEIRVVPFKEDGDTYTLVFLRDISESLRAEEALRHSQSRTERILQGMPDGFIVLDRDWRYTFANRSAAASSRTSPEALLGRCIWDLAPGLVNGPFHQACLKARDQRIANRRFDVLYDYGTDQRWYDYTVFPFEDGVAVHFRDITDRKRAEEAVRRYQFMVDRSPEEAYLVHRDGTLAYANEAAARGLGYTVEELLRLGVPGIDPDLGPRFAEHFDRLAAGPLPAFETVHLDRDGRRITKEMRSFHLRIGEREYACSFGRDISSRKEAERRQVHRLLVERSLRQIDRQIIEGAELREALRAICQAVVDLGHRSCWIGLALPDGSVTPVAGSDAAQAYLQDIRVRWDDAPEGRGPTGTALRTGRPQICADVAQDPLFAPWRAQAERQGYRASVAYPLISAEQEVIGTLNAYRDRAGPYSAEELEDLETFAQQSTIAVLTARRAEALRDALRRLHLQVDRMPLGHLVRDPDRRVLQWNPAAERIFGWSEAEAVGRRDEELFTPEEERQQVAGQWRALLDGEPPAPALRTNRRRSGERIRCEWHDAPLHDHAGKLLGVLSMVADITEKSHLERQLASAQRMEAVGVLAGGVAHDFNNLLTGIVGFGELLRSRLAADAQAVEDIGQILLGAERAASLTRQLLAFARRQPMEPVPTDLNRVVRDFRRMLGRIIGEHVDIQTELAPTLPLVHADPGKIEQILVNLCVNARDAMPQGGRLRIATSTCELDEGSARRLGVAGPGRHVSLEVSDSGRGIDESLRDRVFEPFFTTKAEGRGSGLGLAVSYGIARQHGGAIDFRSQPGQGTTFQVWLPVVEGSAPAEAPRVPSPSVRGGTETILVADDEPLVRTLAERSLAALGYRVLVAADGSQAVSLLRQAQAVDLAILDVIMPRGTGLQALRQMRAVQPGLRILLMSGYTRETIDELDRGDTAFLAKPFDPATLARKVREILDGPAPQVRS